mgnify:CR=1 FL=1
MASDIMAAPTFSWVASSRLNSATHGIASSFIRTTAASSPGSAETTFGRILREDLGSIRDELIISTKAGYLMWDGPYGEWGSRKYLIASLDQSLRRMGLEYVDIFYSHRPDPGTPLEETMGALHHVVQQGKALYAGISNYDAEQTNRAVDILEETVLYKELGRCYEKIGTIFLNTGNAKKGEDYIPKMIESCKKGNNFD